MSDTFDTSETRYGVGAFAAETYLEAQRVAQGEPPSLLAEPSDVSNEETVDAVVNHGRWIIECPWCTSAQFASREDHRFFCVNCQNAPVNGAYIAVNWPSAADAKKIEAALAKRPSKITRNWRQHESLKDLHAENKANL